MSKKELIREIDNLIESNTVACLLDYSTTDTVEYLTAVLDEIKNEILRCS